MPLQKIKFLLQLKFHSRRSLENLFAWKDIKDMGRGRGGVVKRHTDEFWGHRDAHERIKCHQDQSSSNQHACGIYGWLVMSIHRSSAIRAGVHRKRHRLIWWLLCCSPLNAVVGSPLSMKTLQRWGTDRPCALDMCNTARSFAHESNTGVIRRWAFLILGIIDLLSYLPHLLSYLPHPLPPSFDHLWTGRRVLAQHQHAGGRKKYHKVGAF